jgi:hypothetical protein
MTDLRSADGTARPPGKSEIEDRESTMIVGLLQVELIIGDARSLKDKRRVVNSIKDRLHREHLVAVAEVDRQANHQHAVLGIATISNSVARAQSLLDRIVHRLGQDGRFVCHDHATEILTGR